MAVSPLAMRLQYMKVLFLFLPFCFFLSHKENGGVPPTKGLYLNKRTAYSA